MQRQPMGADIAIENLMNLDGEQESGKSVVDSDLMADGALVIDARPRGSLHGHDRFEPGYEYGPLGANAGVKTHRIGSAILISFEIGIEASVEIEARYGSFVVHIQHRER